ncbi:casein kinase substrate phosphoprotein PP28-domain-containing protein [Phakopsora pachyrhizi]|nr:casein kinase substrate phosphoprotein PP28-domain-containing protein [Phakopsora pachyrhizi]
MWDEEPKDSSDEDDEDDEDDVSDSEEENSGSEDVDLNSRLGNTTIASSSKTSAQIAEERAERRAAKKKGGPQKDSKLKNDDLSSDDDDEKKDDLVNPNHTAKKSVKVSEISTVATGPMNRKEREAVEKKAAQERYWKLHQEGKTDQAKVDLARLAKIRQEREQAAAFRKAEAEAKAKEAAEKAASSNRKKR